MRDVLPRPCARRPRQSFGKPFSLKSSLWQAFGKPFSRKNGLRRGDFRADLGLIGHVAMSNGQLETVDFLLSRAARLDKAGFEPEQGWELKSHETPLKPLKTSENQ